MPVFPRKKTGIIILTIVSGFLLYQFLFGRLFPFSPLVIGFEKAEAEKAIIYYHRNDTHHEFCSIDSLIDGVEKFHRLAFKKKVMIFLSGSDVEFKRYTGTTARFVTQPFGGRIFISNHAKNEYRKNLIRFDTYLKHELSHSILYQNMSPGSSLTYPAWFMEGVAMISADQAGTDGYYSYEQVQEKLREGYYVKPEDWGTIISRKGKSVKECMIENKYWFIYSEYALFVDELIVRFGKDRMTGFIKESLSKKDFYRLFNEFYRMSFDDFMDSIITHYLHPYSK